MRWPRAQEDLQCNLALGVLGVLPRSSAQASDRLGRASRLSQTMVLSSWQAVHEINTVAERSRWPRVEDWWLVDRVRQCASDAGNWLRVDNGPQQLACT